MKRLNLFKVANDRTENSIKQQKIITRVYLILLTGMVTFIVSVFIFAEDIYIKSESRIPIFNYSITERKVSNIE
jgi:hypothetical protein